MHPHVESSRTGATALAKAFTENPRKMLINLIEQNPDADKESLFKLFREQLDDEPKYQEAVSLYFFINMYEYAVTRPEREKRGRAVRRTDSDIQHRQMVEQAKAQIVMLDLTMPNGKQMRDCTGAEMSAFGTRFQKIAQRVGKTKVVGAVLSEDQVRQIMK